MSNMFLGASMPQIAQSLEKIAQSFEKIAEHLSTKLVELPDSSGIKIAEDAVYLRDDKGEIVSWTQKEWEEDPSVVVSIVNAVKLYIFLGPKKLRHTIEAENFLRGHGNDRKN